LVQTQLTGNRQQSDTARHSQRNFRDGGRHRGGLCVVKSSLTLEPVLNRRKRPKSKDSK
jgi:hypothetical protein